MLTSEERDGRWWHPPLSAIGRRFIMRRTAQVGLPRADRRQGEDLGRTTIQLMTISEANPDALKSSVPEG
jgi:hypothetical protein